METQIKLQPGTKVTISNARGKEKGELVVVERSMPKKSDKTDMYILENEAGDAVRVSVDRIVACQPDDDSSSDESVGTDVNSSFNELVGDDVTADSLPPAPAQQTPTIAGYTPSRYQQAILDWIKDGAGHAVCNAVAGAGKSSTLLMAAHQLMAAGIKPGEVKILVFNKHNQLALREKFPKDWEQSIATLNSAGFAIISSDRSIKKWNKDEFKYTRIAKKKGYVCDKKVRSTGSLTGYGIVREDDLNKLFKLVRSSCDHVDESLVQSVCAHYGIEYHGNLALQKITHCIQDCLLAGAYQIKYGGIFDYADQLWIPILVNRKFEFLSEYLANLPEYPSLPEFDFRCKDHSFILLDECQDLDPGKTQLARLLAGKNGRILAVGDPMQSIFGFAGADSDSFYKLKDSLSATELPLSTCYRCSSAVVDVVNRIFPDIPFEYGGNRSGSVRILGEQRDIVQLAAPGDMVLSRRVAPTVTLCLRLLAAGKPATIKGRDIGAQVVKEMEFISEIHGFTYANFHHFKKLYLDQKCSKFMLRENGEELAASLSDKLDALSALYDAGIEHGANSIEELKRYIDSIFTADDGDFNGRIILSTIHKAKGEECLRVFLDFEKLPLHHKDMKEWQEEQEDNLLYVAITRSMDELILFSSATGTGKPGKKGLPHWIKLAGIQYEEAQEANSSFDELPAGDDVAALPIEEAHEVPAVNEADAGPYWHYLKLKEKNPEAILLCRFGDFYQALFDDAATVVDRLDIALSSIKVDGFSDPIAMAAVPDIMLDSWIERLVQDGCSVGIYDGPDETGDFVAIYDGRGCRIVKLASLPQPEPAQLADVNLPSPAQVANAIPAPPEPDWVWVYISDLWPRSGTEESEHPVAQLLQPRKGIDMDVATRYSEIVDSLPPIEVYEVADSGELHGKRVIVAGYHRREAEIIRGSDRVRAIIKRGSLGDAIAAANFSNLEHGKNMTNDELVGACRNLIRLRETGELGKEWANLLIDRASSRRKDSPGKRFTSLNDSALSVLFGFGGKTVNRYTKSIQRELLIAKENYQPGDYVRLSDQDSDKTNKFIASLLAREPRYVDCEVVGVGKDYLTLKPADPRWSARACREFVGYPDMCERIQSPDPFSPAVEDFTPGEFVDTFWGGQRGIVADDSDAWGLDANGELGYANAYLGNGHYLVWLYDASKHIVLAEHELVRSAGLPTACGPLPSPQERHDAIMADAASVEGEQDKALLKAYAARILKELSGGRGDADDSSSDEFDKSADVDVSPAPKPAKPRDRSVIISQIKSLINELGSLTPAEIDELADALYGRN